MGVIAEGTKGGTMRKDLMVGKYASLLKKRPGCYFQQGEEVISAFDNLKGELRFEKKKMFLP